MKGTASPYRKRPYSSCVGVVERFVVNTATYRFQVINNNDEFKHRLQGAGESVYKPCDTDSEAIISTTTYNSHGTDNTTSLAEEVSRTSGSFNPGRNQSSGQATRNTSSLSLQVRCTTTCLCHQRFPSFPSKVRLTFRHRNG